MLQAVLLNVRWLQRHVLGKSPFIVGEQKHSALTWADDIAVKEKQDSNYNKRSCVLNFSTFKQLGGNIDKSACFTIRFTEVPNQRVPLTRLPHHPIIEPHEQIRRINGLLHYPLHELNSVLGIDWNTEFLFRPEQSGKPQLF